MVTVVINGRRCTRPAGSSILSALRALDIRIPTLCHDDRLQPAAVCRACLVSVAGRERPVSACSTVLEEGMLVETNTPELEAYRQSLLELHASRYPESAVVQSPEKPFHRLLRSYGVRGEGRPACDVTRFDLSHPYIAIDMSRCIECLRCVRICDELQGQRVWHVKERGTETRIVPDAATLMKSSCVACGACVDTCPTGALDDARAVSLGRPLEWTRTTCPYCGVGCEMHVGTRAARIVSVRPALDARVNKGHLCVKGRYAFGFVHSDDRVTGPMIRKGSRWCRVSWTEARAFVASRLQALVERGGADTVGVLGSARATNEDNYVTQKFARAVIGTNNVDCCARVCHAPSAAALKRALGSGLATNSFDDIERARTILVWGANATDNHPVVGARIRQAARRGAALIVVDPRRIDLAREAAHHLAVAPGTNVVLLNAMAQVIVSEGLCDRTFVERRVAGFDEFTRFIGTWTPERAARICGVDADAIRAAARLYATSTPAMAIHGLGLTEHVQGTDGVAALINLALLTGNLGKAGSGVNPLRGQNNVQGAAHMGCDPDSLPGGVPVDDGCAAFERAWCVSLPRKKGLNLSGMLKAAAAGRLSGLWTIGYDVLMTNANRNETADALRRLEVVIVQDLFLNDTGRTFGTVFLPACSGFEKEGTFMNAERRIQRVRAALRPIGESKPDWRIVAEIARTMGASGFGFRTAEEVWDEVRSVCPGGRGITYARLEQAGLQWPCPAEDHPGTSIQYEQEFGHGGRAMLRCLDYLPTPERASTSYPFILITGRSLYQFNAGTMTGQTRNMELRPSDLLDISTVDAGATGIAEGDRVRVVSAYGAAVLPVHVSPNVARGQLFATFQSRELAVNALTGPTCDGVGTPEYKVTAVRLEAVEP